MLMTSALVNGLTQFSLSWFGVPMCTPLSVRIVRVVVRAFASVLHVGWGARHVVLVAAVYKGAR